MRFALGVEYHGARFHGWQRQSNRPYSEHPTVQAAVEAALSKIADHAVRTVVGGRTDAGVHACGQVTHFDSEADRPASAWLAGANSLLPDDIRVVWCRAMPDTFHARFSALSRHYRYLILNTARPDALYRHLCHPVPAPLSADAMAEAAQHLCGEHDFSTFRSSSCSARSPRRRVFFARVRRRGDWVWLDIQANAFLQHMVRNIAGSLLEVGMGHQSPSWIADLLQAGDRKRAAARAPATGLCLLRVRYPSHYGVHRIAPVASFASWLLVRP